MKVISIGAVQRSQSSLERDTLNAEWLVRPLYKWTAAIPVHAKVETIFISNIFISNMVAKATGLNLGKKLSDLLSNREALN